MKHNKCFCRQEGSVVDDEMLKVEQSRTQINQKKKKTEKKEEKNREIK
jgi:hypothetical protein